MVIYFIMCSWKMNIYIMDISFIPYLHDKGSQLEFHLINTSLKFAAVTLEIFSLSIVVFLRLAPSHCFLLRNETCQVPLFMTEKENDNRKCQYEGPMCWILCWLLFFLFISILFIAISRYSFLIVFIVQWEPGSLSYSWITFSILKESTGLGLNSECLSLSNTLNNKGCLGHFCLPQVREDHCLETVLFGCLIILYHILSYLLILSLQMTKNCCYWIFPWVQNIHRITSFIHALF